MPSERFSIEIDGEEASDLYQHLIGLEVELDDRLAGMFRIYLSMLPFGSGAWPFIDDERLKIWKPVTIHAGFGDETEELTSGYLTHVKPVFDPDPTACALELWGMDASVLMDRQEKLKDWPDKKDSEIASEVFGLYGLTPEVDDTEVIHDAAVSTVIQRETDMQFLQRLALRNGFQCFVEAGSGYFLAPRLDEEPQPVLAAHFGEETTLVRFSAEVDALSPTNVAMFQLDRLEKEVLDTAAESSQQTALGAEGPQDLLGTGMESGRVYVGMSATTGSAEMALLCQGLFHRAEWFVKAQGEVLANRYGHVLKPRRTVTIKGVGETHSGVYYVSRVTHSFTADAYVQRFEAQRNGIMPTGAEQFGGGGALGGLL
jgi:phage protein D